jgi:3-hydroxyacyl-[acyl-carrier-protein] dehydratase
MLLNDFYVIEGSPAADTAAGEVRMLLTLNAGHPIFAAHFPGQPVVPGACAVQMVEELLSHVFAGEYALISAGQIKFLTPIDPRRHPRIEAVLRYAAQAAGNTENTESVGATGKSGATEGGRPAIAPAELQVTATLSAPDATFLKLRGIFRAA